VGFPAAASAGSSAYPSQAPSQQASVCGSAAAYARSSSFPETGSASARRAVDRPPPTAVPEVLASSTPCAPSAPPPHSAREARTGGNASVPKRPDRAPPVPDKYYTVPTPPGVPPPQPLRENREDGTSSSGTQSHVVRRRPIPAPSGSLSARASSRDRQPLDALNHGHRRAHTPERGRQQPPTQMNHLRFAGGGISEVWKPHPEAKGNLPPLKPRTPREASREAADRGGVRADGPPQRELAGAPPPMPPSSRATISAPGGGAATAGESDSPPSKRPPRSTQAAAAPIPAAPSTLQSEGTSLRLQGATSYTRAH